MNLNVKKTLTTGEIAKYCDVHYRTVIRWIERGQMRAHQLPGRGDNRVQLEDFIDFLNNNGLPIPDEFQQTMMDVLVLSAEERTSVALCQLLHQQGYSALKCTDSFEAGMLIGLFKPKLLLMDAAVPGMSGLIALKSLRKHKSLNTCRAILLTGSSGSDSAQEAMHAGANVVLTKPISDLVLLDKVNYLLKN